MSKPKDASHSVPPVRVEVGENRSIRVTNLKESFKGPAYYKALNESKPIREFIKKQRELNSSE